MTIRAKFASACKTCGGAVAVGQEVEWTKGEGVRHLAGECQPREQHTREPRRESTETLPGPDAVPAGRYAVENGDGELRFYRVARSKRNPARVWLHVQHGPSESEVPFSWQGYRTILESIAQDARGAAVRYGREIGACSSCGKRLTNALSRELGIGPVCGGRFYAEDGDEWKGIKDTARKRLREMGIDPDADLPEDDAFRLAEAQEEREGQARSHTYPLPDDPALDPQPDDQPLAQPDYPVGQTREDFQRAPASTEDERDEKYGEVPF